MSVVQLSRLELGTRNLDVSDFIKICGALGELPGDLLPHSGEPSPNLRLVEPLANDLAKLPDAPREAMVHSFRVQIQAIAPHVRIDRPQAAVVPFPAISSEHRAMSDGAMERLSRVMQEAGMAEPRKAARGKEYEVRFYGLASAGGGVELFDEVPIEHRQIPGYYWKKGARGVLKAVGDSMIDVGIFENDILFVKPTPRPENGELVICTVNRKVYVKQFRRNGHGAQLLSKNPSYEPIDIHPNDEVEFFGVVVGRTGDL